MNLPAYSYCVPALISLPLDALSLSVTVLAAGAGAGEEIAPYPLRGGMVGVKGVGVKGGDERVIGG